MNKQYKNILMIGVFDLFHRGHIELIKNTRAYGNNIIVVINGDQLVMDYKNKKPNFSENDRAAILKEIKGVSEVVISNDYDAKPWIEKYQIDAIVHGDDWQGEGYLQQIRVTQEYVDERGIEMIYLPYYQGTSTSQLVQQIRESA